MSRSILDQNPLFLALGAGLLGFLIGLFLFGWTLTPPRFTNAGPEHLEPYHLDNYVRGLSTSFVNNPTAVRNALCYDGDFEAVQNRKAAIEAAVNGGASQNLAVLQDDLARYNQVIAAVQAGGNCEQHRVQFPPSGRQTDGNAGVGNATGVGAGDVGTGATGVTGASGGRQLISQLCMGLVLLGLIGGLGYWFWQNRLGGELPSAGLRRGPEGAEVSNIREPRIREPEMVEEVRETYVPPPPPKEEVAPQRRAKPRRTANDEPRPVGGFETSYKRGDNDYDKSFIIGTDSTDFMGECRVSISEVHGVSGSARDVMGFELWLFDRNQENTLTKIIMSDHAYHDEALRAKVAGKGDAILAQLADVIVLETKSLIINATPTVIEYAPDRDLPDRGVFERFALELSAWVKGDSSAPSTGSGQEESRRADDLLDW